MGEIIAPRIWRVGGDTWGLDDLRPLTDSGCNVYLLHLDDAYLLVDCGFEDGMEQIDVHLRVAGVIPDEITDLLLTHSHFDHTAGAHLWQSLYDLQTHLNAVGVTFLKRDDLRLVGHQIMEPGDPFKLFRVDHAVEDGEIFHIGQTKITAYHLPGHTPDCTLYTLNLEGTRIGICGDVTFAPRQANIGEIGWLCLLWRSDLEAYEASLQRFLSVPLDLLLPGHGHPVIGVEAIQETISLSLATVRRLLDNPDVRHFGIRS